MSLLSRTPDMLAAIIEPALAQQGYRLDRPAPAVWRATGHAAELLLVKAEDGWLTFDAPAPGVMAAWSASSLLAHATSLPGRTKVVAGAPDDRLHLRAELPVDDDADLAAEIPAVIAAFAAIDQGVATASGAADAPILPGDLETSSSLAERCQEAGWPAVEQPDGELAVELEVPRCFVQATVRQRQEGGWWVEVPLVSGAPASAVCREATVRLLLRVSGLVRLVQAVLIAATGTAGSGMAASGAASPGFRVLLPPAASGGVLGHAFAAPSIACRLCAREAAVLWGDAAIAQAYLVRRRVLQEGNENGESQA